MLSIYVGHVTVAGVVTFTAFFLGFTLVVGIIYAASLAFTGSDFSTGFFKFMAVVYVIIVVALIFGLVDLPCQLSSIPSLPNQWSSGCPSYTPPSPSSYVWPVARW